MKTTKIPFAWLLIFFSVQTSFAQGGATPAQLRELIKKVFDNYPRLKQGNEYIKLSQEQTNLARGVYMPIIDGSASYRYAKPTPTLNIDIPGFNQTLDFFPANNYDAHVALTQPIWDFGHARANVQKALTEIQTSKDNLESSKQTLAYTVAGLYYGIVFLNKSVDVQNDQISLLEKNEKIISDRLKDGDALKFDLLSTQVKKNNAQNLLIDLQNSLKKQYEMLNMLSAMDGEGYITQKEVQPNEVAAGEVTPDNNYDIIVLNDQLKSSEWDIKSAKRGWLPVLIAKAQAGTQNGYVPDVNKMEFAYSAGVGIDVPIFSASRPNYLTKIAKINMQAAKYNLDAQKLNLNKDILQTKSDMDAIGNKLKNYDIQIDQAKEALNLAEIRYKAGVITNLELLTAQTDLQNAQLGQIQLQYNLLLSKLQLNKLGGSKFW
jgi:outer membrane protein